MKYEFFISNECLLADINNNKIEIEVKPEKSLKIGDKVLDKREAVTLMRFLKVHFDKTTTTR